MIVAPAQVPSFQPSFFPSWQGDLTRVLLPTFCDFWSSHLIAFYVRPWCTHLQRRLFLSPRLQERQDLFSVTNSLTPKIQILRAKSNGIQLTTLCNRGGRPLESAFWAKARRLDFLSGSGDRVPRPPLQPSHALTVPTLCQPPLRQNHRLSPRPTRS